MKIQYRLDYCLIQGNVLFSFDGCIKPVILSQDGNNISRGQTQHTYQGVRLVDISYQGVRLVDILLFQFSMLDLM